MRILKLDIEEKRIDMNLQLTLNTMHHHHHSSE